MPLACGGFELDCLATVISKIVYLMLPSHNMPEIMLKRHKILVQPSQLHRDVKTT